MAAKLTATGIQRAAQQLGCTEPAVRAVIAVEAGGAGFLPDGRPKILFERHVFSRLTGRAFDTVAPDIANRTPGGYSGNQLEYPRLYKAVQLDGEMAVQSCSWGLAQVMGFNWKACGEKSLFGFLLAVHHSEDSQLGLMVGFIQSNGLADELRRKDWAGFAKGYNGSNYAINKYDVKLAAAYKAAGGV